MVAWAGEPGKSRDGGKMRTSGSGPRKGGEETRWLRGNMDGAGGQGRGRPAEQDPLQNQLRAFFWHLGNS